MLKVQKELVSLKQKANEQELKDQQEARLSALEHEIRDMRTDCIRLSDECDRQAKVISKSAALIFSRAPREEKGTRGRPPLPRL
jgi:hypothetical protein